MSPRSKQPKDKKPEEGKQPTARQEPDAAAKTDEETLVQEQLEEALREKDQFRRMAQRAQADLINYKRRAEEEQTEIRRYGNSQLILKMLPIVDDLERALALVPDDAVAPGWLEGLTLVQRKIDSFLESEGVTKIVALGQPFAPDEHEAISYEISEDGAEEGTVVRVIQEGYKQHDRVLRAAQVTVARAPEKEDEPESSQEDAQ